MLEEDCVGERSPLKKCCLPKGSLLSPFFISWVLKRLGVFYCTKFKVGTAVDSKVATVKTFSPPVTDELMLTYQQVFAISRVSQGTVAEVLCYQT